MQFHCCCLLHPSINDLMETDHRCFTYSQLQHHASYNVDSFTAWFTGTRSRFIYQGNSVRGDTPVPVDTPRVHWPHLHWLNHLALGSVDEANCSREIKRILDVGEARVTADNHSRCDVWFLIFTLRELGYYPVSSLTGWLPWAESAYQGNTC
jgi:hypothetical protein